MSLNITRNPAPAELRELPPRRLDSSDRCQARACTGRAYVEVIFRTDRLDGSKAVESELTFCHHHFVVQETALRGRAVRINDQRDELLFNI